MKLSFLIIALSFGMTDIYAKKDSSLLQGIKEQKHSVIAFTENKGQVHDQNYKPRPDVLFGAMAGNMALHIKNNGVSYQLYRVDSYKEVTDERTKVKRKDIDQQTIYRIDLNWLNANSNFTKSTDEALPGYNNYYLESCPNGALNVKSYTGIKLHNLYNGINLHYYQKNGFLKYDYIVAPHANYKQIQMEVRGADITVNKDGSLFLKTPLGNVLEGAPVVFQNGKQLRAKWIFNEAVGESNRILNFEVDNYNPDYELILDPVARLWGTFYGDTGEDQGKSCSADGLGNVYMAGTTASTGTLLATVGSHQSTYGGNTYDAFLVMFNSNGVRQWGTYYGGAGYDFGNACTVDAAGNIYMTGETSSSGTVVATVGSHQPVNGGYGDAFLVKFNNAGIRQWGTFYGGASGMGGTGRDFGNSCTIDVTGNVYLSGLTSTYNSTAIATVGSHQSTWGGGPDYDAFLVKFNSSGVRQWGTYYGGGGSEGGGYCATDGSGNVYLTGQTAGSAGSVIATLGSFQSSGGSNYDAFLVKFNSAGVRQWGTFFGGINGLQYVFSCATDNIGNVYFTGCTSASEGNFITSGAHQTNFSVGNDAYLAKFNSNGGRLWCTYYGGSGNDIGYSCSTDGTGNVYLSGFTSTNTGTVIATVDSHQPAFSGGSRDAYLVKFNSSGVRQWGTYYGGSGDEEGYSCAASGSDHVYLAGYTNLNSGTSISTVGSFQSVYGGGTYDSFLAKFINCTLLGPNASVNNVACSGSALNFTASITGTATPTYSWSGPNSFTSNIQNPIIANSATANIGVYTLTINNGGCIETTTTQVTTINITPTVAVNSGTICSGNSFTIVPSGAFAYTIQGGNTVLSPSINTSYTVVGTSTAGCISANVATCNITVNAVPIITVNSGGICYGNSFTITPSGANTYTIQGGNTVVSPITNTSYTVAGTSTAGCVSANTATCNVTVNPIPTVLVNSGSICSGKSFTIVPTGASTYTIQGGNFIVNPMTNTSYTVIGTSTAGCLSSNTATSNVVVNPSPTITAVTSATNYICVGQSATLTASGALNYTWNPGGTGASSVISPTVNTSYTVTGVDGNGCSNTAIISQSVNACTGLDNKTTVLNGIQVYPNPTNGTVYVDLSADVTLSVVNQLGQIIIDTKCQQGRTEIDLKNYANGVYYLILCTHNDKVHYKIIKD